MWSRLLLISAFCAVGVLCNKDVGAGFRTGLKDVFKSGELTTEFKSFMDTLNLKYAFRQGYEEFIDSEQLCSACNSVLDAFIEERRNGAAAEDLSYVVIEMCVYLGIETRETCTGLVNINVDTGLYIVDNRPNIRSDHLCAVVAQSYGCAGEIPEWSINLPERTELSVPQKQKSGDEIKILHLTDIHYDPRYLAGSVANCDTYVCCQYDLGMAEDPANGAGFWGDYRGCDTPMNVIQNAFEHIAAEHEDIDYIYFSGDIISHRMWDTTRDRNLLEIHELHDELAKAFPNTPVFSVFGNHEAHPVNVYAPIDMEEESISSQWLYDDVAELWGKWLPEEAKETIRKGGFYSVLLRPGFRLIGLNGNAGYVFNWWILYETADLFGQLQWLSDTLYEAEQNNERVHIITHHPTGEMSCFRLWSREYRRITDRFSNIITGAFNGHTHQNELTLYHAIEDTSNPISIAWNGGSLTTISNLNSNYKIFSVDSESFEILDYDLWMFNVTDANLTPDQSPVWFKLYNFKDAYGMEDLSPKSMRDLAIRMVEDRSLIEQYFRFRSREAGPALAGGCGSACLKNLLCRLLQGEVRDQTQCNDITSDW